MNFEIEKFVKERNKELDRNKIMDMNRGRKKVAIEANQRAHASGTREILLLSGDESAEFGKIHKSS